MLFKKLISVFAVLFACTTATMTMAGESGMQANADTPVSEALIVNINDANADLIADLINGVGAARAQAIIDYREANGPFKSVDELAHVKGIGEATIARNRDRIRLR